MNDRTIVLTKKWFPSMGWAQHRGQLGQLWGTRKSKGKEEIQGSKKRVCCKGYGVNGCINIGFKYCLSNRNKKANLKRNSFLTLGIFCLGFSPWCFWHLGSPSCFTWNKPQKCPVVYLPYPAPTRYKAPLEFTLPFSWLGGKASNYFGLNDLLPSCNQK